MVNIYIVVLVGVIGCGCNFYLATSLVVSSTRYIWHLFNRFGRFLAWDHQVTGGKLVELYLQFEIWLGFVYADWQVFMAGIHHPCGFYWTYLSQVIIMFYLKDSLPRNATLFHILYWVFLHGYNLKTEMIYCFSHCHSYTIDWCFNLCWYNLSFLLEDWYCYYLCDCCKWNCWFTPYLVIVTLRGFYRIMVCCLLDNYFNYELNTWQTNFSIWSFLCRLYFGAESFFNHQCKFLDYVFGFYFSLLVFPFCRKFMLNDYIKCFHFLGAAAVQPRLVFGFQCIHSLKVRRPIGFISLFACSSFERRGLEDIFKDLVTFLIIQRVGPFRGF